MGDFSINVFEFENNKEEGRKIAESNVYLPYDSNNKKLTTVTRNKPTAIDHFIPNTVVDTQFKSGIVQTDLYDHFTTELALQINKNMVQRHDEYFVYKRNYDKESTNLFK